MRGFHALFIALGALIIAQPSFGMGVDADYTRQTLVGLDALSVGVIIDPALRGDGLDNSAVRTDTELKLRQAGIKVYSEEDLKANPGQPVLLVSVYASPVPGGASYVMGLELMQRVVLLRDPTIGTATETWGTWALGQTAQSNVPGMRGRIRDMVDVFLNAYLAANPTRPETR